VAKTKKMPSVKKVISDIHTGIASGEYTKWLDESDMMGAPVKMNNFLGDSMDPAQDKYATALFLDQRFINAGITPGTKEY